MEPGGDRGDQAYGVWHDQAPGIQAECVPGTRGYRDKEGIIANQGDIFCTLYSTLP